METVEASDIAQLQLFNAQGHNDINFNLNAVNWYEIYTVDRNTKYCSERLPLIVLINSLVVELTSLA
jgi:hypothetical protein